MIKRMKTIPLELTQSYIAHKMTHPGIIGLGDGG